MTPSSISDSGFIVKRSFEIPIPILLFVSWRMCQGDRRYTVILL